MKLFLKQVYDLTDKESNRDNIFDGAQCIFGTNLERDSSPQCAEVLIDGVVIVFIVRNVIVIIWSITDHRKTFTMLHMGF